MRGLVCRWVGHSRPFRPEEPVLRCRRCGCEGWAALAPGRLKQWVPARCRHATRDGLRHLRTWFYRRCQDCGRPCVLFGLAIGRHDRCSDVPF